MRFLFLAALILPAGALPAAAAVAILDVTVVDVASGGTRPHVTVIADGEFITSIGRAGSVAIPKGARVVSGSDKFLIPGLWDMHVHLWHRQNQLPVFVAFGVTGVRDMGSDFDRLAAWRGAIEKGDAVGPRIVASGPAVGGETPGDAR